MSETHTDFSGWSEHPETLVAEGDYVAVRSWAGGKQVKDLAAVPPGPAVPNKGRSLRMQESLMFRIADGKVAEPRHDDDIYQRSVEPVRTHATTDFRG
jgi:SnoaL-like polyketide cyclase